MSVITQLREPLVDDVAAVLRTLSAEDLRLRFGAGGGAAWLLDALRSDRAHRAYVARDDDVPVAVLDTVCERNEIEFGLVVAPSHRRRGIAREMVLAMLRGAARDHPEVRFVAACLPENRGAHALLRQLGFARNGYEAEYLRFERMA